MPAILIKTNNPKEYVVVEIQGDLEYRSDREKCEGKFIGDLLFNKYGNPVRNYFIFNVFVYKLKKKI